MHSKIGLGVNIDHVATLRQARKTLYPSPIHAAFEAADAGASNITLHLREDRRHMQEEDIRLLRPILPIPMNLEIAVTPWMVDFATQVRPQMVCFVPEKREELTTEGGLDVVQHFNTITEAVAQLKPLGIKVSLFIDPDSSQVEAAKASGAAVVELHTGAYAEAQEEKAVSEALVRIQESAAQANKIGLIVDAGHGLHYHNVAAIAAIPVIHTLNIGHAIVARSIFCGFKAAVREMRLIMQEAR